MHEDKLTADQRLRLECVAQAAQSAGAPMNPVKIGDLIGRATAIEDYIRNGRS